MAFGKRSELIIAALLLLIGSVAFGAGAADSVPEKEGSKPDIMIIGDVCVRSFGAPHKIDDEIDLVNATCDRRRGLREQMNRLEALPPNQIPKKLVYLFGTGALPVFNIAEKNGDGARIETRMQFVRRLWGTYLDRLAQPAKVDSELQSRYLDYIRPMDQYCRKSGCQFYAMVPLSSQTVRFAFADLAAAHPWRGAAATFLIPDLSFDLDGLKASAAKENLRVVEYTLPFKLERIMTGGRKYRAAPGRRKTFVLPAELFND